MSGSEWGLADKINSEIQLGRDEDVKTALICPRKRISSSGEIDKFCVQVEVKV